MARHKNKTFNIPDNVNTYIEAGYAVLLDIRDELQEIKAQNNSILDLLRCRNVRGGLEALQRIDKRLAKKIPLR